MRHLGVGYPTVWRMKHKLMQAMAEREAGRGSESKRPFVIAVETTQDGRPRQAVIAAPSLCREVVPPPNDTECESSSALAFAPMWTQSSCAVAAIPSTSTNCYSAWSPKVPRASRAALTSAAEASARSSEMRFRTEPRCQARL